MFHTLGNSKGLFYGSVIITSLLSLMITRFDMTT